MPGPYMGVWESMGKYKIFVDGSSGTTGLRIADRLAERDEFEIL